MNFSLKHVLTCLRHGVGIFPKHRPNVYAKKEDMTFILAVELLLPPAPYPGDAVFRCFVAHFMEDYFLNLEE